MDKLGKRRTEMQFPLTTLLHAMQHIRSTFFLVDGQRQYSLNTLKAYEDALHILYQAGMQVAE